jgi:predicted Na+-dependent transporter
VGAALAAIVTVPLLADLGEWVFGVDGWDVLPRQVALQVGKVQLLPLLLGVVLRRSFPAAVEPLRAPIARLANGLLILLVVAVLAKTAPLLLSFGAGNLALLLASTYAPQLPGVKLGVLLYVLITVLVSTLLLKRLR